MDDTAPLDGFGRRPAWINPFHDDPDATTPDTTTPDITTPDITTPESVPLAAATSDPVIGTDRGVDTDEDQRAPLPIDTTS